MNTLLERRRARRAADQQPLLESPPRQGSPAEHAVDPICWGLSDIAAAVQADAKTIRRWMQAGRLPPPLFKIGLRPRWLRRDIELLIACGFDLALFNERKEASR